MLTPDFRDASCAFDAERVEYLLVGAFALAAHGLPRATGAIDLWVRATPDTVVQVGVPPARLDVITSIEGVEFDVVVVPVQGRDDLLVDKRAAGRPKDLVDADLLERTRRHPDR